MVAKLAVMLVFFLILVGFGFGLLYLEGQIDGYFGELEREAAARDSIVLPLLPPTYWSGEAAVAPLTPPPKKGSGVPQVPWR